MKELFRIVLLVSVVIICFFSLNAQNISFEPLGAASPSPTNTLEFEPLENGSTAYADIDNDGDQDFLITGLNNTGKKIAELYLNDGNGNFKLAYGKPFVGVIESSVAFADIDNDNDADVLITGTSDSSVFTAKLYTNDGLGNFTEVTGTPFAGIRRGSVAFADVDNDLDLDVLISGESNSSATLLYINDGLGNFTVSGARFNFGVIRADIAFADIDNDNDQDILFNGYGFGSNGPGPISKFYLNDSLGNFTPVLFTQVTGLGFPSISFADVDNDNDLDLLTTGDRSGAKTELYLNNGSGNYTRSTGTSFRGLMDGTANFVDIDSDNDHDILITGITGTSPGNQAYTEIYKNDGSGSFTLSTSNSLYGVYRSSAAITDIDSDNDPDILITGLDNTGFPSSNLYINDSLGNFSLAEATPFAGVELGSVAFADVDNNNFEDVIITGRNNADVPVTQLYANDGLGNFSILSGSFFEGVENSSIAFADIDGDRDQDVLITGQNNTSQPTSKLYINNNLGGFNLNTSSQFSGVSFGSVAFSDIDNDNDQDAIITGLSVSGPIARLYTNDGVGNFNLVSGTPFPGVWNSSIAFGDVDNDNDEDILLSGMNISNQQKTRLYINDGLGNFSLSVNSLFTEVDESSIAFGDIDNDNDLDILISGRNSSSQPTTELYKNDGLGKFTFANRTHFQGVQNGSIAFADLEGDKDMDIIITGIDSSDQATAKLYLNDGSGIFSLVSNIPLDGVLRSSVAFTDLENDNDLDILITGGDNLQLLNSMRKSILYRNISVCRTTVDTVTAAACDSFVWARTNSTYHLTGIYTDSIVIDSCFAIQTLNLTINPISRDTLTANAANSYTWANNGNTYTANGFYSDTLIASTNCDSISILDLTIDTIDLTLNRNGFLLTSNQAGATYQWIDCNSNTIILGETARSYNVTANGSYGVIVTVNNSFDTTYCESYTSVGINERSLVEDDFSIYPNPTKNWLTIETKNSDKIRLITIYDIAGSLVREVQLKQAVENIDISEFANGIYMVRYGNSFKKLVVAK